MSVQALAVRFLAEAERDNLDAILRLIDQLKQAVEGARDLTISKPEATAALSNHKSGAVNLADHIRELLTADVSTQLQAALKG